MAAKLNSPEFKAQLEAANERTIILNGKKVSSQSRTAKDSLSRGYRYEFGMPDGPNVSFNNQNQPSNKVKESAEYKKLKEQFDQEVKALKDKMEKKVKEEN